MQTVIAYAGVTLLPEHVQEGLARVERAYEGRWGEHPEFRSHVSSTCGLAEWSHCPSTFR